jgi:hypothetical protein
VETSGPVQPCNGIALHLPLLSKYCLCKDSIDISEEYVITIFVAKLPNTIKSIGHLNNKYLQKCLCWLQEVYVCVPMQVILSSSLLWDVMRRKLDLEDGTDRLSRNVNN